jgi:hypothetical protein
MEKDTKEKVDFGKKADEKKFKKKKSVNWDAKTQENPKVEEKKPEVKVPAGGEKDFLEIEVINKDGNTIKERVKYESKESKEFAKKREEIAHNEYTKAKEFLEHHKNEE